MLHSFASIGTTFTLVSQIPSIALFGFYEGFFATEDRGEKGKGISGHGHETPSPKLMGEGGGCFPTEQSAGLRKV